MSIISDIDSDNSLTVSLKMVLAGQTDQARRRGGRQSSTQERGPVPGPHTLHPLHTLQPLPLQQQLLLLQRGARTVVLERCFETREDDWDESNPASWHTRLGPRASSPSPWRTEEE